MKTFVAASAALVASVAASQHRGHPAFHNRHFTQEVCTVYSTVYVTATELPSPVANSTAYPVPTTSCTKGEGEASTTIVEVSSTPVPTPEVPAYSEPAVPAITKAAYTPPAYSEPAYTPPATPSKAATPYKAATPVKGTGSYGQTGRIVTKGDRWAITYTPYTAQGGCKSAGEVQSDLAKIASLQFPTIRVYSTDCGVFENVVPAAQSHGIKVIFGVYLNASGGPFSSYAEEQVQSLIKNAPKDSIAMVIVGNEACFNGFAAPEQLGEYIDHVRQQFLSAGFPSDIAFTTTETVDVWLSKGAALCAHIDVFAVQVHPFFNPQITASQAGDFAASQLALAAAVCPEAAAKGKYITEIGWPVQGSANGNAVPGKSQQKEALTSILAKVGTESCVFSFQNDFWKSPGAFGVEQYWGVTDAL